MIQLGAMTCSLNECRLGIGDFCCSIACKDPLIALCFREYYSGFLVSEAGGWRRNPQSLVHGRNMLIRFIIYGLLGWCGEIIWTATREKLSKQQASPRT